MKTLLRKLRRLLSIGGAVAALTAGAATNSVPTAAVSGTAAPDVAPTPLKVRVNSPASWGMLVDERLDVGFTEQLRAILNEMGFAAPVEPISVIENPDRTPYLLTLNLTEWRIDRSNRVSCVFDATLQTPQGTRYLGLYTHNTLRWQPSPGRWGLAVGTEVSPIGGLYLLCDMIARTASLPGLPSPAVPFALRAPRSSPAS